MSYKNLDIIECHGKQYLHVSGMYYSLNTNKGYARKALPNTEATVIGHLRNKGGYMEDFFAVLDGEESVDEVWCDDTGATTLSTTDIEEAVRMLQKYSVIKTTPSW